MSADRGKAMALRRVGTWLFAWNPVALWLLCAALGAMAAIIIIIGD